VNTRKSKTSLGKKRRRRYPVEFKLRAVRLHLEEGYAAKLVAEQLGDGHSTLSNWIKRYREEGEAVKKGACEPLFLVYHHLIDKFPRLDEFRIGASHLIDDPVLCGGEPVYTAKY